MTYSSIGLSQATSDLSIRSNYPTGDDVWSLSGRCIRNISEISGRSCNLLFIGQSTNNNGVQGFYSPSHGKNIFNLSLSHPMKDKIFEAKEPLLTSDLIEGHHGLQYADQLISGGHCDSVVITPIAAGGSFAADFSPSGGAVPIGTRTGSLSYRIGLAARCLRYAGLDHLPTIIDWQHGEWDSDGPTPYANVKAAMQSVIDEFKHVGILKSGNVMFVNKCSRPTNSAVNRNIVRQAQADVVDGVLVKSGADIDTLGPSYRYDGTHFTSSGAGYQAALKVPFAASYLSTKF